MTALVEYRHLASLSNFHNLLLFQLTLRIVMENYSLLEVLRVTRMCTTVAIDVSTRFPTSFAYKHTHPVLTTIISPY